MTVSIDEKESRSGSGSSTRVRVEDPSTRLTRRTFLIGIAIAASLASWRFLVQPFVSGVPATRAEPLPAVSEIDSRIDVTVPTPGHITEVTLWGPRSTRAQNPFNPQANGGSALWFNAAAAPAELRVVLGNETMGTKVQAEVVTAHLSPDQAARFLRQPGIYPVRFELETERLTQLIGFFHVLPGPGDRDFLTPAVDLNGFLDDMALDISGWGPRKTAVGAAFNLQRDGRSAFWVQTSKELSPTVLLTLDGIPLVSTLRGSLITAGVIPTLTERFVSEAGSHTLRLVDPQNRRFQVVGSFLVQEP